MLKSVCAEYMDVEVLLLFRSGRESVPDVGLEDSLDETEGGSWRDSLRASRFDFDVAIGGAGVAEAGMGVRSRGGRGGGGVTDLAESNMDKGGGGKGPAVECFPGS